MGGRVTSSPATISVGALGARQRGGKDTRARPGVSLFARLSTAVIYVAIALVLGYSWLLRHEGHLTAESGLGYALGIGGVAATVLLLAYPLRKRLRALRNWGLVATWFHFHMLLGILAPVLILAHSNFRFGSLNSSVALMSMLIVAASGVIGRYIYTRIHFGLYGARATLGELQSIVSNDESHVGMALTAAPSLRDRLFGFAATALSPANHLVHAAGRILLIGIQIRWIRFVSLRILSRALKQEARRSDWSRTDYRREKRNARRFIANYLGSIRRTVQLSFYERLFALWHVLHIPLFFMLVIATAVHILAVHMY